MSKKSSAAAWGHSPCAARGRTLSAEERTIVRKVLNSRRFQDCAPREVYATLLDKAIYLCSWRTMYRILVVR